MAKERIRHDILYIQKNPQDGIILGDLDDIMHFDAFITGPEDTPYASGLFQVDVKVPGRYPFSPPKIKFKTTVFHPNICESTGIICLDILDDEWCPAITLLSVLEAMQGLMRNPNSDSPMNATAAHMMSRNITMYNNTVQTWTHHFAGGSRTVPEYEEKIEIVSAVKRSVKRSILDLTEKCWEVESVLHSHSCGC